MLSSHSQSKITKAPLRKISSASPVVQESMPLVVRPLVGALEKKNLTAFSILKRNFREKESLLILSFGIVVGALAQNSLGYVAAGLVLFVFLISFLTNWTRIKKDEIQKDELEKQLDLERSNALAKLQDLNHSLIEQNRKLIIAQRELVLKNSGFAADQIRFDKITQYNHVLVQLMHWIAQKQLNLKSCFEDLADISRFSSRVSDTDKLKNLQIQTQVFQAKVTSAIEEIGQIVELWSKIFHRDLNREKDLELSQLLLIESVIKSVFGNKVDFENKINLDKPLQIQPATFITQILEQLQSGHGKIVVEQLGVRQKTVPQQPSNSLSFR